MISQVAVVSANNQIVDCLANIGFLIPSNSSIWLARVKEMEAMKLENILKTHFGSDNSLKENVPGFSSKLSDGDRWLILCALVLSEIQPRLTRSSQTQTTTSCPANKKRNSDNYFLTLILYFSIYLNRIPKPTSESWRKSVQYYCITQEFGRRYCCNGNEVELLARYMACFYRYENVFAYLEQSFEIPIVVSQALTVV